MGRAAYSSRHANFSAAEGTSAATEEEGKKAEGCEKRGNL